MAAPFQSTGPVRHRRFLSSRILRRALLLGLALLVTGFAVIQVVPYGRDHENPPGRVEPLWQSAQAREIAVKACFDCHSNESNWPWYTNVAPISWLAQSHVDEGREELNFSEWDRSQEIDEAAETITDGEMPPFTYLLTHPEARLSDAEKLTLVNAFRAMPGGEGERSKGRESDEDERDDDHDDEDDHDEDEDDDDDD